MGLASSALEKLGLPGLSSVTTKHAYENHFKNKKTGKFEDFHVAYVEFCKYVNTIIPGQDFDTPPREMIEDFYKKTWEKEKDEEKKKEEFFKFMAKNVKKASVDDTFFIMAGLAAPAAAVVGKRASGNIPYVKNLRLDLVPNVVFVPAFTLFAIVGAGMAQISRKKAAAAKAEESAAAAKAEESEPEQKNKKDEAKNA
ncbi:uncharacterized protein LOC133922757 [Phragmites australis]|uniref:uncharacterized protein LOC133922757 n=1 Tax=Phragmites australis TaxID=29695 RepID=UPI002D77456B|nr:uncharacterized protein LOC133922757 [Phragmites australis]